MKQTLILAGIAALMILTPGCGGEELQSLARDRDIVVDGKTDDWQGILKFLEDADLSYGLTNDAMDMYVVFVVGDRNVRRQIMMSGLYLWFNPSGNEDKQFGVRFPIGLQKDVDELMSMMREQDPNELRAKFDQSTTEMMVIGAGDVSWRRVGARNLDGIEAVAAADENMLVLEFKVPVSNAGSFGYGIGADPGSTIGLGVETPEIDQEKMREQMQAAWGGRPGGERGGVDGGMGSGGRGGRMRPPGGERPEFPDPIKVWATVQLATGAAER